MRIQELREVMGNADYDSAEKAEMPVSEDFLMLFFQSVAESHGLSAGALYEVILTLGLRETLRTL